MELGLCRSHCWRIICRLAIKGILAGPVKRGTWSHYAFRGVISLSNLPMRNLSVEDLVLRGTSRYSAIAPSSDAANSSAARKDKEGLFLFDGYFGRLNYRKDGIALFEIHSLH